MRDLAELNPWVHTCIAAKFAKQMPVENVMNFLKKAAVATAALTMVAAPVAASAAPAAQFDGLRASTSAEATSAFGEEAGGSWILMLLAAAAIIGGIVIAADGSNDSPTSP